VKKLNKKRLLFFIILPMLLFGTAIAASALFTFNLNMNMTVPPSGTATITVGGQTYTNGQAITLDWGTVTYGGNSKTITITNNCNTPLTPSLQANPSLPSGCTLTLSLDTPIPAGQQATGTLTINVPSNLTPGTYSSMTAKIDVSYS
jgi:hypothetical protein